jgi:putative sterol carrier protein
MADRTQVIETLKLQRQRFSHEKIAPSFKGWTRIMQYHFTDLGLEVALPVTDGVPGEIVEGKAEQAHIFYEMSSETFLAIHRKELSGMKAFTQKLVKVKASMPDLLKLQKLDAV